MVAALAVTDFRESESWNVARSVVCAILDLTESWSTTFESKRFAAKVERLSTTLLDDIAKGYEGGGNAAFLAKAAKIVDELETELEKFRQKGKLEYEEFLLLRQNLDDIKLSLRSTQSQF